MKKSDFLEADTQNIFLSQAMKIKDQFKNVDLRMIENLLEEIDKKFNEDDAFFLLNILTKKYPEILSSYCCSKECNEKNKKIIFDKIENIKKDAEDYNEVLELMKKSNDPEFQEILITKIKFQKINQETYYSKFEFFKNLPENLQDDLIREMKWLSKKEIQQKVLELEEIYIKVKEVLKNNTNIFVLSWLLPSLFFFLNNLDVSSNLELFTLLISAYWALYWFFSYDNKKTIESYRFDTLKTIIIDDFNLSKIFKDKIEWILETIRI